MKRFICTCLVIFSLESLIYGAFFQPKIKAFQSEKETPTHAMISSDQEESPTHAMVSSDQEVSPIHAMISSDQEESPTHVMASSDQEENPHHLVIWSDREETPPHLMPWPGRERTPSRMIALSDQEESPLRVVSSSIGEPRIYITSSDREETPPRSGNAINDEYSPELIKRRQNPLLQDEKLPIYRMPSFDRRTAQTPPTQIIARDNIYQGATQVSPTQVVAHDNIHQGAQVSPTQVIVRDNIHQGAAQVSPTQVIVRDNIHQGAAQVSPTQVIVRDNIYRRAAQASPTQVINRANMPFYRRNAQTQIGGRVNVPFYRRNVQTQVSGRANIYRRASQTPPTQIIIRNRMNHGERSQISDQSMVHDRMLLDQGGNQTLDQNMVVLSNQEEDQVSDQNTVHDRVPTAQERNQVSDQNIVHDRVLSAQEGNQISNRNIFEEGTSPGNEHIFDNRAEEDPTPIDAIRLRRFLSIAAETQPENSAFFRRLEDEMEEEVRQANEYICQLRKRIRTKYDAGKQKEEFLSYIESDFPSFNILSPKEVFTFKHLFFNMKNKRFLAAFLSAILKRVIAEDEILKTQTTQKTKDGNTLCSALLKNGTVIETEMQREAQSSTTNRALSHWADAFQKQAGKSEDFDQLHPRITIKILDFNRTEQSNRAHTVLQLVDKDENSVSNDTLEIHFLELPKLQNCTDTDDPAIEWLRFINAESQEEMRAIQGRNEYIAEAYDELIRISRIAADENIDIENSFNTEELIEEGETIQERESIKGMLQDPDTDPEQIPTILDVPMETVVEIRTELIEELLQRPDTTVDEIATLVCIPPREVEQIRVELMDRVIGDLESSAQDIRMLFNKKYTGD